MSQPTPHTLPPAEIEDQPGTGNSGPHNDKETVMQNVPAPSVNQQGTAGRFEPTRDLKEIYLLSAVVLFLAALVAAFWTFSSTDETPHTAASAEASNTGPIPVAQDRPAPFPVTGADHSVPALPGASLQSTVLHDDIFFEIGRKGLTDDGKAVLRRYATFLAGEPDWGILLQGYTDQQGSISYNKTLGLKRAETVKDELVMLGVPETSIRTVSLGEEGALCIDQSDICRGMNRRVHLEVRKVGLDHMKNPAALVLPDPDLASPSDDPQAETQAEVPLSTGLPESPDGLD